MKKMKGDLKKLLNRTFTTGFLFDECKYKGQETKFSHIKEEYVFVGEVIISKDNSSGNRVSGTRNSVSKRILIKIKVHNAIFAGDRVEFIQPKGDNFFCKIKNIYECGTLEKLKSAHGGQERTVYIEVSKIPETFSILRKKVD